MTATLAGFLETLHKERRLLFHAAAIVLSALGLAHYGLLNLTTLTFLAASPLGLLAARRDRHLLAAYRGRGMSVFLWLAAAYFAAALIATPLMLSTPRANVTFLRVATLVVTAMALRPCLDLALLALERTRALFPSPAPGTNRNSRLATSAMCAAIVLVVGVLASVAFYPCTMTNDSVTHWEQATGIKELTDYNPLVFTLLLRVLFAMGGGANPYPYCLFQIVLLSLVAFDASRFLSTMGAPRKPLLVGSALFAFFPSTFVMPLYVSKNPLTAIWNLWTMLCLVELLVARRGIMPNRLWTAKTAMAVAGLYLTRENNVVVVIPLVLMTIHLLYRDRERGKRLARALVIAAAAIGIVNGYCYTQLPFKHVQKSHETVRPLLAPAASAMQQGLELPDSIKSVMIRILPEEEWVSRYDSHNSDPLTWKEPKPAYENVAIPEAFGVYVQTMALYPDVVIKDRLDATNIIWDIGVTDLVDNLRYTTNTANVYNLGSFRLMVNIGGIPHRISQELNGIFTSLLNISANNNLIDVFVWRCGIYIVLFLVEIAFLLAHKRTRLLWTIAPSVCILLTFFLVIAWQMYFYVWFFPLAVTFFWLASAADVSNSESGNPVGSETGK